MPRKIVPIPLPKKIKNSWISRLKAERNHVTNAVVLDIGACTTIPALSREQRRVIHVRHASIGWLISVIRTHVKINTIPAIRERTRSKHLVFNSRREKNVKSRRAGFNMWVRILRISLLEVVRAKLRVGNLPRGLVLLGISVGSSIRVSVPFAKVKRNLLTRVPLNRRKRP